MNLTAATITVYFVGLMTFQQSGTNREVIIPQAEEPKHARQVLPLHAAHIVIDGATDCTPLGGAAGDTRCTAPIPLGATITLPNSTAKLELTDAFEALPRVKTLCPGVRGLRSDYIGARLLIAHGKLDACVDVSAWISRLTLEVTDGPVLEIGDISVGLRSNAVVQIINAPLHPPASSSTLEQARHFWWNYALYQAPDTCIALPDAATGEECTDYTPVLIHGTPAASGVGCSNTAYP